MDTLNLTADQAVMHCDTAALNAIIRGELAAVQTYEQALAKFGDDPAHTELTIIREDHRKAVGSLSDQVRTFGGEPSGSAGAWGAFASAVEGVAKMVGPQAALAALKQGEEHGIGQYQAALDNPGIADECKFLIRSELLPRSYQHIATLDRLIGGK
jgi:hypothetical protein